MPPRIIDTDSDGDNSPEKIEVILNDTALLQCPVSAVPPPQITWFKNGEELTDAQLAEGGLTILNDGKQLRLRSAGVEDTGRYTCVARNLAGETEKNIDLQILGRSNMIDWQKFFIRPIGLGPNLHRTIMIKFDNFRNEKMQKSSIRGKEGLSHRL